MLPLVLHTLLAFRTEHLLVLKLLVHLDPNKYFLNDDSLNLVIGTANSRSHRGTLRREERETPFSLTDLSPNVSLSLP